MIVDKTNALRRSKGIPELERHWPIKTAARKWSLRMARTGDFEHSNLGWSRGRRAGENIAMAPTGAGAFRAMLNSPPHRRNLLNRTWRLRGIGVAAGCDGMLLRHRQPDGPLLAASGPSGAGALRWAAWSG